MNKKWPTTILTFTGIFIAIIFFRLFCIEIYSIPSSSMENTLLPGDKVLVNKLAYGPKLPVSPYDIPWVNLVWFLQAGASANPDSVYRDYRRLPGFSVIKRGDVFESLLQPLIVLIEIPIDIATVLILLWITGNSLNLMALIGIIVIT